MRHCFCLWLKLRLRLTAGNTIVIKSAEQAPICVLFLAEIINRFLPAGVLNVISGYGEECGKPLCEHPIVRKVTFTGSLPVGQAIASYAAPKLATVTLELGGKNPEHRSAGCGSGSGYSRNYRRHALYATGAGLHGRVTRLCA